MTSKQIFAIAGIVVLVLYVITLLALRFFSSASHALFATCLLATVAIPLLIWIYTWMFGKLTNRSTFADFHPRIRIKTSKLRVSEITASMRHMFPPDANFLFGDEYKKRAAMSTSTTERCGHRVRFPRLSALENINILRQTSSTWPAYSGSSTFGKAKPGTAYKRYLFYYIYEKI